MYLNWRNDDNKSTDDGNTWELSVEFGGDASEIFSLLVGNDGTVYAGTDPFGGVYRLEEDGVTWTNIGDLYDLFNASRIEDLLQTPDGRIYASTSYEGDIIRLEADGVTWINLGGIPDGGDACSIYQTENGAIYFGGSNPASVYRYNEKSDTWTDIRLPEAQYVNDLLETTDHTFYAATSSNGDVFKSNFSNCPEGQFMVGMTLDLDGEIFEVFCRPL